LGRPPNLHFSPVDLERESLAEALDRTPYERGAPDFFSLPGLIMYLTRPAIVNTLQSISTHSAGGSEVAFDYLEPEAFSLDAAARVRFAMQRACGLGEPMLSGLDPGQLAAELASLRLVLREDLGPAEIYARFLDQVAGYEAVEYYHLARAELGVAAAAST
jgi:O-methyltransferase involved in polyketide biosynthesis